MSSHNSVISVGAVGDVKYSILDPETFSRENGEGWVLMDGQSISGTDLWRLTGIERLPDARGVFVRGMNVGRNAAGNEPGDADGNRAVGSYQPDTVINHGHKVNGLLQRAQGGAGYEGRGMASNSSADARLFDTTAFGGNETRPRNIALYTYIKVSNPAASQPTH